MGFLAVNVWSGDFFGISLEALGIFLVLSFSYSIRSNHHRRSEQE